MAKRVRIVFFGLAMLAMCLALAPAAPAQDRAPSTETIQLWLARICVHEMTWHVEHDCEPMFQVFNAVRDAMGRRRHTLIDAIARYSSRFYGGTGNRPWARLLRPGLLANPEGWPEVHLVPPARRDGALCALVVREARVARAPMPRALLAERGHLAPDDGPGALIGHLPRIAEHPEAAARLSRRTTRWGPWSRARSRRATLTLPWTVPQTGAADHGAPRGQPSPVQEGIGAALCHLVAARGL